MARISVVEAARSLGVHPQRVHQRIRAGSLPAQRIGNQWTIEEADLELVRHRKAAGRPLSSKSAWALVAAASSDDVVRNGLSDPVWAQAHRRLQSLLSLHSADDLNEASASLAIALGNRARRELFTASAKDLPDLRADQRLHLSGVSLPDSNIAAGELVEGYVRASDLDGLTRDYLLSPTDPRRANVVLHVVDPEIDDSVIHSVQASLLIRAADLAEHVGAREKNEALKALAELQDRLAAI